MYTYDDFYEEPSEFDEQIAEFKEGLMKSVKQEFLDNLNRLEKENAELRDFKKRKKEIEQEHSRALADMKYSIQEAERRISNQKLSKLFGENLTVGWGVKSIPTQGPKCNKCDDNRKVHFKSPSGKDFTEPCECDKATYIHQPEELSLIKFYINSDKNPRKEEWVERHYARASKFFDSDYDEYRNTTSIYKDEPFEKVHKYGIVFLEKDACIKYCEWLNKNKTQS